MKKFHRILAAVMAVFSLSLLIPTITPAQAATTEKVYVNPVSTYNEKTGQTVYKSGKSNVLMTTFVTNTLDVRSEGGASKIKDLKVNKSGLTAKVTYTYGSVDKQTPANSYRLSTISMYARKTGKYNVTFKVNKKTYKLKVAVVNSTGVWKKVTYGSDVLYEYTKTNSDNGYSYVRTENWKVSKDGQNFTVTANKDAGYKITGLIVMTADKKGNASYKTIKNGGKITLSKGKYTYTDEDATYTDAKKTTYVYISYKNTKTGAVYK